MFFNKMRLLKPPVFLILGMLFLVRATHAQDPCEVNMSRPITFNVQGAVADGMVDDTDALQSAIDRASVVRGKVFVPRGIYLVNAVKGISIRNNLLLHFDEGAILKAAPTENANYSILRISNASDVVIVGGVLQGERYAHLGRTGEWGMGVYVEKSHGVVIKNLISKDNWGDGFYVAGASSDVRFCSVVADGNRRQGLSIVSAENILVKNSIFINTKGTSPEAGIDIEPNEAQSVSRVNIINSKILRNNGSGVAAYASSQKRKSLISNIRIEDSEIAGNLRAGIMMVDVSGFHILKNVIEKNNANAIFLDKSTRSGVVKGNRLGKNGIGLNAGIVDQGANFLLDNELR